MIFKHLVNRMFRLLFLIKTKFSAAKLKFVNIGQENFLVFWKKIVEKVL